MNCLIFKIDFLDKVIIHWEIIFKGIIGHSGKFLFYFLLDIRTENWYHLHACM